MTPFEPTPAEARRGAVAAGLCYLLWGLVPLYWKQLRQIDAVELIAHRHVWSLCVLVLLVAWQRGFGPVFAALGSLRSLLWNATAAVLLTANWLIYVYGVNTDRMSDCSLGYYLVPLVNVAVGRFALQEPLRRVQWLAIAIAASGVGLLVVQLGGLPWIALVLAGSWSCYSLMRKHSRLGAAPSLLVETLLLSPLAIGWLAWLAADGNGALGHVDGRTTALVLSAGLVTAVPLVLFAFGARRIRLTTLGLLQYLSPSVQLMLAVLLYHEPFPPSRAVSFGCIWLALAVYTCDGLWRQRRASA